MRAFNWDQRWLFELQRAYFYCQPMLTDGRAQLAWDPESACSVGLLSNGMKTDSRDRFQSMDVLLLCRSALLSPALLTLRWAFVVQGAALYTIECQLHLSLYPLNANSTCLSCKNHPIESQDYRMEDISGPVRQLNNSELSICCYSSLSFSLSKSETWNPKCSLKMKHNE